MTSLDSPVKIRYRGGEMTLTGSNLIHEEIHRLEVELRVERAVLKRAAKAGITGKFCDYMYMSPRYGYKHAHKYDKVVYVYLNGHFDDGYFETLYFKHLTNKAIIARLAGFKEISGHYKKAINSLL